ncbi:MAG: NTP transferase domain-containing protein [Candidatus Wallbacteria bacterium]|nr:NTP transferase domain-containing protein [Candidatus Wallbacteria bacterium]
MKIVVPMSGTGERFSRAGHPTLKPLIEVEGKPMVAHVIELFPGETDFLFICNRAHLADRAIRLQETLERFCPTGRVVGIDPHKLGPVHAVAQAAKLLDPGQPVVVNYCDFACYWDWNHFRRWVSEAAPAGAIPAYRGFHPHSLGPGTYAYLREQGGQVLDIQEKQPFTDCPMEEPASSGTYYFARGELVTRYFAEALRSEPSIRGEHYVSQVYRPMLRDGLRVGCYDLQHFMQWGTPEDLSAYRRWSDAFRALARPRVRAAHAGAVIVPAAGEGDRFARAGYPVSKPLIEVSGRPMIAQAVADLPEAPNTVFIVRGDTAAGRHLESTLLQDFPGSRIVAVPGPTEGQAATALAALPQVEAGLPLTIGACDMGAVYEPAALEGLLAAGGADVIVWTARSHEGALRTPGQYGWVELESGRVVACAVKRAPERPSASAVITGAFTFRRAADFGRVARRLLERNGRVNGELYIDSCLEDALALGLDCRALELDHYLGWGTPDDLKTFEYWQSCFHKWAAHPYRLERDARVAPGAIARLERRYAARLPSRL